MLQFKKIDEKFKFNVWRGTEHMIALSAVATKLAGTSKTKSKIEQKHKGSGHNKPHRLQKPLERDSFAGASTRFLLISAVL